PDWLMPPGRAGRTVTPIAASRWCADPMALERWTGAGEGESRPTRPTGPPPGTGHTDGDGGRVTLLDGKPRHVIRDRLIRAAPAVAAASLLALAAAEAASLPGLV